MTFQESETLELKEIVVEDIKKEIIAFANSAGGTLYVGVADNGRVVGGDNPDTVTQQISNMVRDSIKPDVTMFIRYDTKVVDGKQIVAVEIQRGTERGRICAARDFICPCNDHGNPPDDKRYRW